MNTPQKPQHTPAGQTGNLGTTWLHLFFEERGWIVRTQNDQNDFGIDVEIEVVQTNLVTGMLAKGQIKSTMEVVFHRGETAVPVKVTTYDLWRQATVPVFAFLVDTTGRRAYWTIPMSQAPGKGARSLTLKFYETNELSDTFQILQNYIEAWYSSFSHVAVLDSLTAFHRLFKELDSLIDWGDPWADIGEEHNDNVLLFYGHVVQLRLALGCTEPIIPMLWWQIRNRAIWHERVFYYATFSELMLYIRPFYLEAIDKLKQRLANVTLTIGNEDLIQHFRLGAYADVMKSIEDAGGHCGGFVASDPILTDQAFHDDFERILEQLDIRRCHYRQ